MPLEPGQLRHKIDIYEAVETSDGKGGYVTTYPTVTDTVWAKMQPLGSRDRWQAEQVGNETTHTVTLRYTSSLTRTCRIVWDSRNFNVISIRNPEERDEMMIAMVKEDTT